MFQQIKCKAHSNVNDIYFVNMAQIKCVEISEIKGKENCFSISLQFGGECRVCCSGFIVGGYETIDRFINSADSTLSIDSTKL